MLLLGLSGCATTGNYLKISERLDYFLEISIGSEYGSQKTRVVKWTNDLKIIVFGSPTDQDKRTLNEVIAELNDILGDSIQLNIVESNPNVEIYFIPKSEFHLDEPSYVPTALRSFGTHGITVGYFWTWWDNAFEIYKAKILISTEDISQIERSHMIREELTQSLGLMNDSWEYEDSIFYQGWTEAIKYLGIDKEIIKMLYHQDVVPGMTEDNIRSVFDLS